MSGLTFHLLLQREAPVDLLQLGLHGQASDVGLQVRAVHHADAEHDERDVLRLGADQATAPAPGARRLVGRGRLLLLVLEDHLAERLRRPASTFWRHDVEKTSFSLLSKNLQKSLITPPGGTVAVTSAAKCDIV